MSHMQNADKSVNRNEWIEKLYDDVIYYVAENVEQSVELPVISRIATYAHGLTRDVYWDISGLTHCGQDKMAAISQAIFSNTSSWMKMRELCLKFHWSLFLRFELTISQHCFR